MLDLVGPHTITGRAGERDQAPVSCRAVLPATAANKMKLVRRWIYLRPAGAAIFISAKALTSMRGTRRTSVELKHPTPFELQSKHIARYLNIPR